MSSEQTREVYQRARLGQSVTLGARPAVLVVDFSRGFTDPECAMGADLTKEVEATRGLLDVAREAELPVIFTTIGFEENLKDGSLWLATAPGLADLQVGPRPGVPDFRRGLVPRIERGKGRCAHHPVRGVTRGPRGGAGVRSPSVPR